MRISKCVTVSLVVALAGLVAAGQDKPAPASPSSPSKPSNTRSASCTVWMTVDPAIMPLDSATVNSLIRSPAVMLKAAREALSLDTPEDLERLNQPQESGRSAVFIHFMRQPGVSSGSMSPGTFSPRGRDEPYEDDMRQLEQVYGPGPDTKDEATEYSTGAPSLADGASGGYGMGGGGALGGMAGTMSQGQGHPTETQRQPGETDVAYRTRLARMRSMHKMGARGGMGGMGSMGSGMMGGVGMGGMGAMGGGMMGGMGMSGGRGGMGGFMASGVASQGAGMEPSITFELQVSLPDAVPPLAEEFLRALVENLRDRLHAAYERCDEYLVHQGAVAEQRYSEAQESLMHASDGDTAASLRIRKQLDMDVDLSQLNPQTPLEVAVQTLRAAVEPPLNIVVLWRDLRDSLSVEPSSPIDIDGMPKVRLGTMLDLLVKSLPAQAAKPVWRIKGDVVVIGTTATLAESSRPAQKSRVEMDVRLLTVRRAELTRQVQDLALQLAGMEARRKAIDEQVARIKHDVDLALAQDSVIKEMENVVATSRSALAAVEKQAETQIAIRNSVQYAQTRKNVIEASLELAKRREELSKEAGGAQLDEFNKELSRMAVNRAEAQAQMDILQKQLEDVRQQLAQASAFDPEAERIRIAQEAVDIVGRRVIELQTRRANLQPPTVTVIGAD